MSPFDEGHISRPDCGETVAIGRAAAFGRTCDHNLRLNLNDFNVLATAIVVVGNPLILLRFHVLFLLRSPSVPPKPILSLTGAFNLVPRYPGSLDLSGTHQRAS